MRLFLVLVAACAAFAGAPVSAQQATPPTASTASPAHVAAAREALTAMLVESGALTTGARVAVTHYAPQLRQQLETAPFFAGLTPERQQAALAYLDRFPNVAAEEVERASPSVLDTYSLRTAAIFSEAELNDIAAMLRTPAGRSLFVSGVASGASGEATPPEPTAEELAQLEAFNQTAGGRAWVARETEFSALLREMGGASMQAGMPMAMARFARDVCGLIGDQCPPELQQAGAQYR